MNADKITSLTGRVLSAIFEVSNTLGPGFLEKVPTRPSQRTQPSWHLGHCRGVPRRDVQGHVVGEYFAGILVEDALVLELKCVERLANEHIAQCLNYLRASGHTICLLVNFQKPKVEWKRVVNGFPMPVSSTGPRPTV